MKKKKLIGTFIVIIFLLIFALQEKSFSRKHRKYIGVKKCKVCHNDNVGVNQYKIWQNSPHAFAFQRLKTAKAREIALKHKIKNPTKSRKCLKCHTTGMGRNKSIYEEGVGCEACHGPGEIYNDVGNHVDFTDKPKGYRIAKKNGMYPILDYETNLKKREKLCLYCHNSKRECMPTDKDGIQKQKITIQVIDQLRKGDVNFYHSPHR